MNLEKTYIIWLSYFDCSLKRKYGRKVSLELCIDNPKPEEILEICKNLKIECNYVEKKYPRAWFKSTGCVIIKKWSGNKNGIVKIIAKELKLLRNNRR